MYSIWVPFELPPNTELKLEELEGFSVCGYPAQLCKKLGYHGLSVEGLPDEGVAYAILSRLNAALLYAVAHTGPSIRFDWEPASVHYEEGEPFVYWKGDIWPDGPSCRFNASRTIIYLRVCSRIAEACEAPCHELDHGGLYEGETGGREALEVL